jgi:hypothetical protein
VHKQELATPTAREAARAAAVQRARNRGGPARGRGGGGEAGEDAWKGSERHGGGGSTAHGQQSGDGSRARREQRRPGLEEEEGGCFVIFQKCRDLTEMCK